jgi:uncharacterized protein YgiM (DUF1202 family)
LRVRETASTAAKELTQVKPGQRFPFIDEDSENNWFKIEYEAGKEGWVTGQYAKKIEVDEESSPTPTPKKTATPSATLTPTKKPSSTATPTPKPTATP